MRVPALVFLAIGVLCALIGRILLIGAAFGVSIWWGLGVFLPFGPLFFRLSYPDLAPLSRKFRLAVLPCLLGYFALRTGPILPHYKQLTRKPVPFAPANHYALEKISARQPTLEERRTANNREF